MKKSCKTCANPSWRMRRPAVSESCLTCAFGDDGTPTNWEELTSTNGDRVRSMNDAALAEWIVSVIDFALRQNGIVKPLVVCAAYKQCFLRYLMRPAEEVDND